MSDFGDFEAADAWDLETTVAPEQVERFEARLRRRLLHLRGADLEQAIAAGIDDWLTREGPR